MQIKSVITVLRNVTNKKTYSKETVCRLKPKSPDGPRTPKATVEHIRVSCVWSPKSHWPDVLYK